jgi:hypothetical protein
MTVDSALARAHLRTPYLDGVREAIVRLETALSPAPGDLRKAITAFAAAQTEPRPFEEIDAIAADTRLLADAFGTRAARSHLALARVARGFASADAAWTTRFDDSLRDCG